MYVRSINMVKLFKSLRLCPCNDIVIRARILGPRSPNPNRLAPHRSAALLKTSPTQKKPATHPSFVKFARLRILTLQSPTLFNYNFHPLHPRRPGHPFHPTTSSSNAFLSNYFLFQPFTDSERPHLRHSLVDLALHPPSDTSNNQHNVSRRRSHRLLR